MSKIIDGVPEFLTHAQYIAMFESFGFEPKFIQELRLAADGVHAVVFHEQDGKRVVNMGREGGYYKHRVFIPVRRESGDVRTTRVTPIPETAPMTDPRNLRVF